MPFEVLSHTADTGIEATADTLHALIGELATGMASLVGRPERGATPTAVSLSVAAGSAEDLVVDALSELLYHAEVEDIWFASITVGTGAEPMSALIGATTVPLRDLAVAGPAIKAVTYHDLVVERRPHGWFGRVYFDV